MDSLTQIVIGAATGEIVLGKKLGNRAMIWGGIAGTIPDLDVLSNIWLTEIQGLALHRGITHSIIFPFLSAPFFGWLAWQYYQQGIYKKRLMKAFAILPTTLIWLLLALLFVSSATGTGKIISVLLVLATGYFLFKKLWSFWQTPPTEPEPNRWMEWNWLFFWGFTTHWMIDACTTYGTQIFQPFSDYRFSLNNISVVDPLYTIPFMICLIVASRISYKLPNRRKWLMAGLAISSIYLTFTFVNKYRVDNYIKKNLTEQNIPFKRFMSMPSIFNNILWQTVAETEDAYYYGYYSFFDSNKKMEFKRLPKNHELLANIEDNHSIDVLKWFTKGYYNVFQRNSIDDNGQASTYLQFNDLRFGMIGDDHPADSKKYAFKFKMIEISNKLDITQIRDLEDFNSQTFSKLWDRILGRGH